MKTWVRILVLFAVFLGTGWILGLVAGYLTGFNDTAVTVATICALVITYLISRRLPAR